MPQAFPEGTIDQVLTPADLDGTLSPRFETRFTRRTRQIVTGTGDRIEWVIDDGTIKAPGGRHLPIAEIELEVKAGRPEAVFDFALRLLDHLPLSTQVASKGKRGLALADDHSPQAVKAAQIVFEPGIATGEAFTRLLGSALDHWLANLDAARAGDARGIHQMRVALRRLRSALRLLRPLASPGSLDEIESEIRTLAAALGVVRDWDIFINEGAGGLMGQSGQGVRLDPVRVDAANARTEAFVALHGLIDGPGHTRLVLILGRLIACRGWSGVGADEEALTAPAAHFTRKVLKTARAGILKRGVHLMSLPPEGLHTLRIRLKRLRYTAEFFASLYGAKPVKVFLARCTRLQDLLGGINDAQVADGLVSSLGPEDRDRAFVKGVLFGAAMTSLERDRKALRRAWCAFKAVEPFWQN